MGYGLTFIDCFNSICRLLQWPPSDFSVSEDAGIEPRTISDSVVDPGSGAFLTPGSGMGKKSGSGSGTNNPDHISESLLIFFWVIIFKFYDADPGSGMEKIRIRYKHPGSATLISEPA
jgi:hypothetical protein